MDSASTLDRTENEITSSFPEYDSDENEKGKEVVDGEEFFIYQLDAQGLVHTSNLFQEGHVHTEALGIRPEVLTLAKGQSCRR